MSRKHRTQPLPTRSLSGTSPAQQVKIRVSVKTYPDTPAFGFRVIQVGDLFTLFIPCRAGREQGWIEEPTRPEQLFFSEHEADAYQAELKAEARKPQLILPAGVKRK